MKINIENLVQSEAALIKNFHMPVSEIERLPYWQYEMLIEEISKLVKEENERNGEQNGGASHQSMMKQYNSSMSQMTRRMNSMSNAGMSVPKMPKI